MTENTPLTTPHGDTEPPLGAVVVAVGPEGVDSALQFGVEEARRNGRDLFLLHAVRLLPVGPESMLVAAVDVERIGRETLSSAVEHAERLAPDLTVTHQLRQGSPVQVLVQATQRASMVVLEHRHLSRFSRIVNRTVAGGVAAHTHVPVVAVPSGWTRTEDTVPVVVVGIDVPERAEDVIAAAAQEARARGAALRLVRAWWVPATYEDLVTEVDVASSTERAAEEVTRVLDKLSELVEGIQVDVQVTRGRPPEVLIEASRDAELLVVGRHDPLVPIGSHVGPVARAVLREAACPVLLAAPHPRHAE